MELNGDQIDQLNQLINFYYSHGEAIRIADVTKILYPVSAPDATNRREQR